MEIGDGIGFPWAYHAFDRRRSKLELEMPNLSSSYHVFVVQESGKKKIVMLERIGSGCC